MICSGRFRSYRDHENNYICLNRRCRGPVMVALNEHYLPTVRAFNTHLRKRREKPYDLSLEV